mgnify:CR=1 FL=1
MSLTEQIETKLRREFAPLAFELIDESERHRGHSGYREGGESHFRLRMTSERFSGQSRVARQRAVNATLAAELSGPVHALAMELKAPDD